MGDLIEPLVIVGAGPAGLAAATAAARHDPLVIDAGPTQRHRRQTDPVSIVQGVGGAGLFSDGKFSFWPSGTALWSLEPTLLLYAYNWLRYQLTGFPITIPPRLDFSAPAVVNGFREKRYPSVYLSIEDRHKIISTLASAISRLETNTRVVQISRARQFWSLRLDRGDTVHAHHIILASGRYGSLLMLRALPAAAFRFLRVEVGVRIEQDAREFFLADHPQLDPKYVWRDAAAGVEWRTFCCCRDGLVVGTACHDIYAVSGRADCPPTGRSNVGFNVRFLDSNAAAAVQRHTFTVARGLREPVAGRLGEFLERRAGKRPGPLANALGPTVAARLAQGLDQLIRHFPGRGLEEAVLLGPAIEGVGWYPVHDETLSTPLAGLRVAGDLAGSFRGLTAALISGYIAGSASVRGR